MKKKQRNIVTFWQNIRRYFPYAVRSAKAELKSEVADSYLNWLWWIIEPFAFMLVYVFIFNYVFKNNTPYFASFVFIGQTLWGFFNRMVNGSCKLIMNNRGLVSKVYVPKYILLLSKSFVYLFKMAISLGLTFVIMAVQGVPLIWTFVFIIPIILTLYIVSFGISIILMHCGVFLNDLSNLVAIGMNLLFYLSGIFYNKLCSPRLFCMPTRSPIVWTPCACRYSKRAFRASNGSVSGSSLASQLQSLAFASSIRTKTLTQR